MFCPRKRVELVGSFSGKQNIEPVTAKIQIVTLYGYSEPEKIEKAETKESISTLELRKIEDIKFRCSRKLFDQIKQKTSLEQVK